MSCDFNMPTLSEEDINGLIEAVHNTPITATEPRDISIAAVMEIVVDAIDDVEAAMQFASAARDNETEKLEKLSKSMRRLVHTYIDLKLCERTDVHE